jgi:hypothetical protein
MALCDEMMALHGGFECETMIVVLCARVGCQMGVLFARVEHVVMVAENMRLKRSDVGQGSVNVYAKATGLRPGQECYH